MNNNSQADIRVPHYRCRLGVSRFCGPFIELHPACLTGKEWDRNAVNLLVRIDRFSLVDIAQRVGLL